MVNIFDDLAGVGFPVYQQGAAPAELPDEFVTVWEYPSDDILHGDNKAFTCRHEYEIIFYTKDYSRVYSGSQDVIKALKAKKYTISGQGGDAAGTWEGYAARTVDAVKLEYLED